MQSHASGSHFLPLSHLPAVQTMHRGALGAERVPHHTSFSRCGGGPSAASISRQRGLHSSARNILTPCPTAGCRYNLQPHSPDASPTLRWGCSLDSESLNATSDSHEATLPCAAPTWASWTSQAFPISMLSLSLCCPETEHLHTLHPQARGSSNIYRSGEPAALNAHPGSFQATHHATQAAAQARDRQPKEQGFP